MPEYITKERAMDCVYEAVKATDANAQDLYAIRRKIAKEPGIGWVSVKDRMPDKPYSCLVFIIYGWIAFDFWEGDSWAMSDENEITHWMPLPEPPEVSKDA